MRIKKKKRFYTILSILLILLVSGVGYGAYTYYQIKNPQDLFEPTVPVDNIDDNDDPEINVGEQFDKNKVNILLVGFDQNSVRSKTDKIFRTDTNILASIDLKEKTVELISIPRDSYVPIAHRNGKDKMNSAYGYGYRYGPTDDKEADGMQYTMDTVSELLGGIPINHYVAVDMDVAIKIVDQLGGVEIEVPVDLYKRHGKDKSEIIVPKGKRVLNGHDLVYFGRYRHFPKGDIQRVENQQKILMATFDSIKKSNKFTTLPQIFTTLQKNIKTNLNFNQIAALAFIAKDMNTENINKHTVEGFFGNLNGTSYWIINEKERVNLVNEVFGIQDAMRKQDPTNNNLVSLDVSISKNILEIGETAQISAKGETALGDKKTFTPEEIIYTTSNSNITKVDENGRVTATGPGNSSITIQSEKIKKTLNVTVNGPKIAFVSGVSAGISPQSIKVGETAKISTQLKWNNNYENKEKVGIAYTSSDNNIASVNDAGVVIGKAPGTVSIKIVAKAQESNKSFETKVNITVEEKKEEKPVLTKITVNSLQLKDGQKGQLVVTGHWNNGTTSVIKQGVTYLSNDSKIAEIVNSNGEVIGHNPTPGGKTVNTSITVSINGLSTTSTVTVTAPEKLEEPVTPPATP